MARTFDRRELLGVAAGVSIFLIVPRHVLGQGFVAPSDKVALGYIGCGTQGLREMMSLLPHPDIRVAAVCDPNKDSNDYRAGGAAGRGGMGGGLFSSGIGGASSPEQGLAEWIAAVRGGPQTPSSFLLAGPISEMVNLGAVALRAGSKVVYDSAGMKITNVPEANKYLTRDYRKGWEL